MIVRSLNIRIMKQVHSFCCLFVALCCLLLCGACSREEPPELRMAVEFMDHAAAAYVALDKGWFAEAGCRVASCESYVTGMALSSALARGEIQAAYICLIPALNAVANAGVDLRIVAGTHQYGYGLVVHPDRVREVGDLEKPGLRIGCVREGGSVDVLLHRVMREYDLDPQNILPKVRRMNPPKQVMAIRMDRLDAAFLPEQWAGVAEDEGFAMLLTARDVWPSMQGSVLVVTRELMQSSPDVVKKMVQVNQRATDWINAHPEEAAHILARRFSLSGGQAVSEQMAAQLKDIEVSGQTLQRSMQRIRYTTAIRPEAVQEVIEVLMELDYIKQGLKAADILDLRFQSQ